jgi:hypothetical protein
MSNQPAEAYHVRQYLVNCFVPHVIANLFTGWAQAQRYLSGDNLYESLNLVVGYNDKEGITTITYPPFYHNDIFWYDLEYE